MGHIDWKHFFTIALIAAFSPWVVKKVGQFWDAVERYDQRRDDKIRLKKEVRAARKAAKGSAKPGPHYTSATVAPPPRLGHDRSSDSGSSEST